MAGISERRARGEVDALRLHEAEQLGRRRSSQVVAARHRRPQRFDPERAAAAVAGSAARHGRFASACRRRAGWRAVFVLELRRGRLHRLGGPLPLPCQLGCPVRMRLRIGSKMATGSPPRWSTSWLRRRCFDHGRLWSHRLRGARACAGARSTHYCLPITAAVTPSAGCGRVHQRADNRPRANAAVGVAESRLGARS